MPLPQDYVNYTKILLVDSAGIKHPIYPTKYSQNPRSYYQNSDGEFKINPVGTLTLNSNVVVLDGDYSDILVHGMRVVSPNLPNASHIHVISTTAGITSITLKNKAGSSDKLALLSTNERLKITRFNYLGNPRKIPRTTITSTTTTADAVAGATQLNLTSVTGIEEGMFINSEAFVNDNDVDSGNGAIKVVGVGTSTVELSHPATFALASGSTVSFMSNDTNSKTWTNFKNHKPSENTNHDFDYDDELYDVNIGGRFGLSPEHAQINGSFYIDDTRGLIHFSSNLSGELVVLDYLSDSLGTEDEMKVHKFAEEAMYKCLLYSIASGRVTTPEYMVQRLKKERFAAVRTAKLRLSNLKIEELTQILRNKSKWIKH